MEDNDVMKIMILAYETADEFAKRDLAGTDATTKEP